MEVHEKGEKRRLTSLNESGRRQIVEQIETALEIVRPYLQADGGDVRVVRVTDDGIVELKWEGTCVSCPMSIMTLRAGVERALMLRVAGIKRVEAVTTVE